MKRLAWLVLGGLLLLAGIGAAGAWLLASTEGFRWLAARVAAASDGRLAIEGVAGHLGMPLSVRQLSVITDTRRIDLVGLRFEWRPRALWQRRLDVDLLAAQTLRVTVLKADRTPPEPPPTLRLPVDVRVRNLALARLEWHKGGQTFAFQHLRGQLDDDGVRYRLSGVHAETPWAALRGQLDVAKDAPFTLNGQLDATRDQPVAMQARLVLTGPLAAPAFRLDATAEAMRVFAAGEAAPFAAVRLPRLVIAGEGLDPRLFAADAPAADLAFSGVFEGQRGERLLGTFSVVNRLAGRLDQRRLPLARLTGAALGNPAEAAFSQLVVDLGPAGQLRGDGRWRDGRATLNLAGTGLDLAGLHRSLYATRLAATLRLAGDAGRQRVEGDLHESWGQGRFALSHAAGLLRLEAADFRGGAGQLAARGELRLDRTRAFALEFDATRINPARFGRFPRARLNARGRASGALAPRLRLSAQFSLPPGELDGRPVSGQGQVSYADAHLEKADIDIALAGNRARVRGAYGRAGDRLDWAIDAPALGRLGLGLAGRVSGHGSLAGEPARPQLSGQMSANGLRLPGHLAVDTLDLRLELQADAIGPFTGHLEGRGVRMGHVHLDSLHARAQGRRDAHTLAIEARLPQWQLDVRLAGGLDASQTWRGQLTEAQARGPWPIALAAPATLTLSRTRQQVEKLALSVAGGQVRVEQASREGESMTTRGSLANLPLAPLLAPLPQPPPFKTDLRVDGEWALQLTESVDGHLRLMRRSGDVRFDSPALDLGLTTLTLQANAVASRVTARVEAATREAGQLYADGEAVLVRESAGWRIPRGAPLAWTAYLDVPDLRVAKPFLPIGVRADAHVQAHLTGSGSLADPRSAGRIHATVIRFAMPEEGILIRDGQLDLVLAGDRLRVAKGELLGSGGRIVVTGEAEWRNPQAGLDLGFERFVASNRSDRRITVSGSTRLALDARRLQLTGSLTADRARLEMPEASRPVLSDDVILADRPPREKPAGPRLPLALDLRLGLGQDFRFKGRGFDGRLGGELRVFTLGEALRGEGVIQVEKGRYHAYAQSLDIARGVLRFAGPLDDPGLDVLAVRKTAAVTAGVQVRGSMKRPLVTLVSDPPLPETEKLAWLVLGHGLEKGGQQEFAALQLAAGALLSRAESASMQASLADALRIDSFGVRAGEGENLASTVVSVGKRLSSRATLSYEQSVDGLNQVVKVLYQLSPRVRLEAQTGAQSSFDAFYTREYD